MAKLCVGHEFDQRREISFQYPLEHIVHALSGDSAAVRSGKHYTSLVFIWYGVWYRPAAVTFVKKT